MSPICYLNASLYLTCFVLGVYVVFHLFIIDRIFWRIITISFLITGCLKLSGLYKSLLIMAIDPDNYICFYNNDLLKIFPDTALILIAISIFVFFISGKCSKYKFIKEI